MSLTGGASAAANGALPHLIAQVHVVPQFQQLLLRVQVTIFVLLADRAADPRFDYRQHFEHCSSSLDHSEYFGGS